jgi:hypothetical protein
MNEGAFKLIRKFVNTLLTPEARTAAASNMTTAWTLAGHREKRQLRRLMERRIAKQAAK